MKKNELLTKSLLGIVAAGLITGSCSNDDVWTNIDSEFVSMRSLGDEGMVALPISIKDTDMEYINFINKLSRDIIREPAIARQFASNPKAFLKQYGYEEDIVLDEGLLKLVLSLGDEEINNAVNGNDIPTALCLMQEKGYLEDFSKSNLGINFTDEEIKRIYKEMGIEVDENFIIHNKYSVVAVWPVYVIAALVSQVGVGYNIVAGIDVAVAITVYLMIEAWGETENTNNVINSNLPLKIWSLKGLEKTSFIAADKYVTSQAKKVLDIVKSQNPDLLNFITETELEQIIKLNILYYSPSKD